MPGRREDKLMLLSRGRHLMLARIGWAEVRLTASRNWAKQYRLDVIDLTDGRVISEESFGFFEDADAAFASACSGYHRLIVDEGGLR